jgi:hypothetical protein
MERLFELWGKFPTTQARVTMTLGCVLLTGLRYVVSGLWVVVPWEPSYEWLGFLLLMSGVDAIQYLGKRTTDSGYVAAKLGTPPAPTPTDEATTR